MDTTLLTKLNKWAGTKGIDYLSEDTGLSACFKWLVPNLGKYIVRFGNPLDKVYCHLYTEATNWIMWVAETPLHQEALALCLAIEKLIDGEK